MENNALSLSYIHAVKLFANAYPKELSYWTLTRLSARSEHHFVSSHPAMHYI